MEAISTTGWMATWKSVPAHGADARCLRGSGTGIKRRAPTIPSPPAMKKTDSAPHACASRPPRNVATTMAELFTKLMIPIPLTDRSAGK